MCPVPGTETQSISRTCGRHETFIIYRCYFFDEETPVPTDKRLFVKGDVEEGGPDRDGPCRQWPRTPTSRVSKGSPVHWTFESQGLSYFPWCGPKEPVPSSLSSNDCMIHELFIYMAPLRSTVIIMKLKITRRIRPEMFNVVVSEKIGSHIIIK